MNALGLEDFFIQAESLPIIDVRSPDEFIKGHIPNAINLPILNNEHRAIVGTIYKESGNETAVIKGFELVGPLFSNYILEAKKIVPEKKVLVHCWRGGMRSNIMAWLLKTAGFETYTLIGGYKTYRRWALDTFNHPKKIRIIGGLTGSGKTELLNELKSLGEQTIDLEQLAHHKGSAFGGLGMINTPTNEQFENELAMLWSGINPDKTLWLEDESQNIGKIKIPDIIYKMMREAPVLKISIPFDIRLKRLVEEYTKFPREDLKEGTKKIAKRLGHLRLTQSLEYIDTNEMESWVRMMLEYYDKAYNFGLSQRNQDSIIEVSMDTDDFREEARKILHSFEETAAIQKTL